MSVSFEILIRYAQAQKLLVCHLFQFRHFTLLTHVRSVNRCCFLEKVSVLDGFCWRFSLHNGCSTLREYLDFLEG